MRNSTCIICFKEFEPREGKLYCSNACKQKGFTDKKNEAVKIEKNQKEQEGKKAGKQYLLYFSDYQEYHKKYPDSLTEFPMFCFFRKNFTGSFDIEQFRIYVKNIGINWDEFWDWDNSGIVSPARKKYNEFLEKFFGGDDFIISFDGKEQV